MVVLFAHFQAVRSVQRAIAEEFGVELDCRTIEAYNPESAKCRCGQSLRRLWAAHREAYIGESAKVAISHQNHRLRLIERLVAKAETAKDFSACVRLLELAAKEMGGSLTKERTVMHEGSVAHVHMSIDDARAELAMRLAGAIENQPSRDAP